MLKVDHRRQNLLAARAFVLLVERLLVADVGKIASDRRTKPIHDALGTRDLGRAVPVA